MLRKDIARGIMRFPCDSRVLLYVTLSSRFLFVVGDATTFPLVLWYCWLGLLTCTTVFQITYTVLVETLNPAQSMNATTFTKYF